jgi:site-specific DNA-methyltransferase (adenine-specific)
VIKGGRKNVHPLEPTVKPIDLMRWLVRLVTPPGGTVLDPFAGSGTTGAAAVLEGFDFVGLEREADYVEIAKARIAFWASHPTDLPIEDALASERQRSRMRDAGQEGLF